MLNFDTFKELYSRIKEGKMSERSLSKEFGVNRNCINQIKNGKHKFFSILGEDKDPTTSLVFPAVDDKEIKKPVRCKQCGGYNRPGIPCFACAINKLKKDKAEQVLASLDKKTEVIKMG